MALLAEFIAAGGFQVGAWVLLRFQGPPGCSFTAGGAAHAPDFWEPRCAWGLANLLVCCALSPKSASLPEKSRSWCPSPRLLAYLP